MNLYYITRVNIPSQAAQSIQISSMCEAFNNEKIEFKLISTLNRENINLQKKFNWDKIKLVTRFKYLEFVVKSFFRVLKEKPTHIFTRDIVVGFLLSFLNVKVAYEAHKEPKTKTAHIMIKLLKNKKNFKLITISNALKKYYIKEYNYLDKKIFDYHDAVFIEKYDIYRNVSKKDLRKELGLPLEKTIVIHTGSLYPGRGAEHFETIIKHFKEILFVQVGGTSFNIKNQYKNCLYFSSIK